MKKILVVDDSALMRRVLCDIINADGKYEVADNATNGLEALELLSKKTYDAVVLDVNMPKMTGIELLRELQAKGIAAKVMMASTDTRDGASVTMEALELGALDFVHKPGSFLVAQNDSFKTEFLRTLEAVVESRVQPIRRTSVIKPTVDNKVVDVVRKFGTGIAGNKVVAIASSTGGPKALQAVIPHISAQIKAPLLIVQHMPAGFTKSFAERLDSMSQVAVKEAEEGDILESGKVYLARGGMHMNVVYRNGKHSIHYSDQPTREGVKPCANYMYESLMECGFQEVVCVVLTGMGADGTKGICNLKEKKKITVIAQNEATSTVYGMPKSIVTAGLAKQVLPIEQVAQEIMMNVGVK